MSYRFVETQLATCPIFIIFYRLNYNCCFEITSLKYNNLNFKINYN